MTLVICDYGSAQFIIAGDTISTDIMHKTLNATVYVHVLQPGNFWSGSDTIMLDLNNDGIDVFGSMLTAADHNTGGSQVKINIENL